ncbi:hypothetical protein FA15DRAFT_705054 [Coprinopsis marcescibilis]|uniref:DUF6533 domain-containing protein n=1 Tax=Coprinopsis marcescibilis TaxID=230819 RepID=A0A5C3KVH4_COPMA|nr:hypothetical protein FA15DRAFT_705054 [Coprinopsis marcescibilis]
MSIAALQQKLVLFVDGATYKQIIDYVQVAMITLAIIDYIQTFRLEVKYVWNTPWSLTNTVFMMARYSFVVVAPLSAAYHFTGMPPNRCHLFFSFGSLTTIISVLLAEGNDSAFARVRNFWSRVVNHDVPGASFCDCASWQVHTHGEGFINSPIHFVSAVFALSAASELVIFLIMCWFAFRKFRDCGSGLYALFIRDGIVYFVLLTAMAIINTLMSLLAPLGLNLAFASIQSTTAFILSTRMILHLREVSEGELEGRISKSSQQRQAVSIGSIRFGPWLRSGLEDSWTTNSSGL